MGRGKGKEVNVAWLEGKVVDEIADFCGNIGKMWGFEGREGKVRYG